MSNEQKLGTVQQPAQPTQPVQQAMSMYTHPGSFDPHNIMNIALTGMISEQLFSVLKSQEGLTFQKILKLLAITSIDEVRKALMSCIKKLFVLFGENYIVIFKHIDKYIIRNIFVTTIYNMYLYIKHKLFPPTKYMNDSLVNIQETIIEDELCDKNINIQLNLEESFVCSLFNYIKSNKTTTHYKINDEKEFILINNQKFTIREIWNDISIDYDSVVIYFDIPLIINYNNVNGKVVFESFDTQKKILNKIDVDKLTKIESDKIKVPSDLISNTSEKQKFKEQILKYNPDAYKTPIVKSDGHKRCIDLSFNYISSGQGTDPSGNYTMLNLIEFFQTKFLNLDAFATFWELEYIFLGQKMSISETINTTDAGSFVLFGYEFQFQKSKIKGYQGSGSYQETVKSWYKKKSTVYPYYSTQPGFLQNIKYLIFCENNEKLISSTKCIPVKIHSEKLDKQHIMKTFVNFINHINTFIENKQVKEPVKSYIIKIEREEKIMVVPNPEYIAYQKKKKEIDAILGLNNAIPGTETSSPTTSTKEKKTFGSRNTLVPSLVRLLSNIPPETIEKTNIESKIKLNEVNEIYKSFDNLYLREDDKIKLKNILEMFYDNKELMNEYGIPHKLGVLLYGVPGTGKSSTIQVIATWLKKNIYCVDFKSVKTNKDFFQIVEYICKHCTNGGILVLEDFDAMGSVMHKRTSSELKSETLVDLVDQEDSELTLDYILNILQGSLTPSGFVFIATTNHIEKIDEAVYRDGRIDIKIDMKLCNHYQIQTIYKKFLKREIPSDILKNICEDKWTPANIIFRVIHYVKGIYKDEEILDPFIECSL